MNKNLLLLFSLFVFFVSRSQVAPVETDPLGAHAVFYIPTATDAQLTNLKTEFAKYSQIQSAVYAYGNHKCLIISFADVATPDFTYYYQLIKVMSPYIDSKDIKIKTPDAYAHIAKLGIDLSSFTVK